MKKSVSFILTVLLALGLCACASGTESGDFSVSGRVIANGQGVAEVTVSVNGEAKTVTDAEGRYNLSGMQGKLTVSSAKQGYKLEPKTLTVTKARDDADFNAYKAETDPEPDEEHDVDESKIAPPTDGSLYDDFDKGIKPAGKWNIVNKKWGADSFNGVTASNVRYSTDGSLILRSKGRNYPNASERETGACIISKDTLGPGKFEIAAKISPRLGMCSAFWNYYFANNSINHEIDIEFPGRPSGNREDRGFDYVLNTNWTSVSDYTTDYVKLSDKKLSPMNDGKWHKYGFEWSAKHNYVKYYIDDVGTAEIKQYIPKYKGQLWIGVWEPVGWAGTPDYEVSDMLIDWVGYRSFNETASDGVKTPKVEFLERSIASAASFPTEAEKTAEHDYVSNGDFSGVENAWTKSTNSNGGSHVVSTDYLGSDRTYRIIGDTQVSQKIFAVYDGYKFDFGADGKITAGGDSGSLKVKITFTDNVSDAEIGQTIEHAFTGSTFERFEKELTVPKGAKNMTITFIGSGSALTGFIDNVSLKRILG